jgi:hypothetical protein
MEFAAELYFGLHVLEVVAKGHLSKLGTQRELTSLLDFVLVLDIRVHITKKQLLVCRVCETNAHSLVR